MSVSYASTYFLYRNCKQDVKYEWIYEICRNTALKKKSNKKSTTQFISFFVVRMHTK